MNKVSAAVLVAVERAGWLAEHKLHCIVSFNGICPWHVAAATQEWSECVLCTPHDPPSQPANTRQQLTNSPLVPCCTAAQR